MKNRIGYVLLLAVALSTDYSLSFLVPLPIRKTFHSSKTSPAALGSTSASLPAVEQQEEEDKGFIKSITEPGTGSVVRLGDIASVKYTCYHSDDGQPFAVSTNNKPQKFVVGDGTMIEGWEQALRTMRIGERCRVRITNPALGYGSEGVPPVIPPDAVLELDLHLLDAQPATANIDFDALVDASDTTPRTAADIAAAYAARQKAAAENRGGEEELTGLDAFLEKARNFYFYGLFEGETGERPPWFLRPSITFPLAFLIVGGAFYVSLVSGAISERGAPVQDELDEIILSSLYISSQLPF